MPMPPLPEEVAADDHGIVTELAAAEEAARLIGG